MLTQLGHVVHFWKQGQQASFLLETQQSGEANLSIRFHLPQPHSNISKSAPASHPTQPHQPIPPLFPNGQIPRPHHTHTQQRPHPPTRRSPKYYRQNYRRGVLYRAGKAAQNLPPPLPNSLRALATRSLEENNCNNQSTPIQTRKRRRSTSSPPSFRNTRMEEQEISDAGSIEQLRFPNVINDTGSPEGIGCGEERLEAGLEEEKTEDEAVSLVDPTDWSQEIEKVKGQKVGEGALISWSEGLQSESESWKGAVWVTDEGGIQVRSDTNDLLRKEDILLGEEYWKESGELEDKGNFSMGSAIRWRNTSKSQQFAIIFTGSLMRDRLYDHITRVQKAEQNELGFGLFD